MTMIVSGMRSMSRSRVSKGGPCSTNQRTGHNVMRRGRPSGRAHRETLPRSGMVIMAGSFITRLPFAGRVNPPLTRPAERLPGKGDDLHEVVVGTRTGAGTRWRPASRVASPAEVNSRNWAGAVGFIARH